MSKKHLLFITLLLLSVTHTTFAQQSPTAIPIQFTLKQAGYVTLVIENNTGTRVRNLISETWFPDGKNTVQWDGLDDLGRDADAARHGVYNVPGKMVTPGQYKVRGLVRGAINAHYELATYSTGTPPWRTEDHTGAWLANHTPPQAALFVPATASPTKQPAVLLGCYITEGPDGMAWVDMNGRKRGGRTWVGGVWTAAPFMAMDNGPKAIPGTDLYVASAWETNKQSGIAELRLNALSVNKKNDYDVKQILKYTLGAIALDDVQDAISGIAVNNGILLISLRNRNRILMVDVNKGKVTDSLQITAPAGMYYDATGRLLLLSGNDLLRFTGSPRNSRPEKLIDNGLDAPYALTLDKTGNIYISDRGKSHTVKIFSPSGKYLRQIGTPGAPAAGPYNPQHMNNPAGITIDAQQQLWVTEADYLPKRVSVWSLDGKLLHAYYGPPKYGGGGTLDPQDKSRFYYADDAHGAMEFSINWQTGTSTLKQVYYRPDANDLPLASRNAAPETPLYYNGQQYFTNCYNNNPTSGAPTAFLFIRREGIAYPVAAMGQASQWDILKDDAFKSSWPQGVNLNAPGGSSQAFFMWQDQNGDGRVQPGEVKYQQGKTGGVTIMPDLSFCIARINDKAVRFAPTGTTRQGVPLYDINKGKILAQGVQSPASSGGDQLLEGPDGWSVLTLGTKPFSPLSVSGTKDGTPVWSYPDLWPGLHASHNAPVADLAGQLTGTTRLLGGFFNVKGSDIGPLWAINGNHGNVYIFTADGLFVASLFQNMRSGRIWRMPSVQRNMSLDSITLGEENFWPSITATQDGKVYLVDGARSAIVRLDGMDNISRLPDMTINVNQSSLNRSLAAIAVTQAANQLATGPKTLQVNILSQKPVIDGKLNDWSSAAWADIDKRGVKGYFNSSAQPYDVTGALAVSGGRLYAAFRTGNPHLADNSGEMPQAPFKTGGALDIMIGSANTKADPNRRTAVAGDCRLLISVINGKPQALLYRAVVPGTRSEDKVPFSSPSRTITFDRVDNITGQLQFAASGGDYELSIPVSALGLQPSDGLKIKGDVGILRGDKGETTSRLYWSNKATGITADVPSEALLSPDLWGTFQFRKK
ncbi:NHL repeat-containing protein [Chitinophaga filiformis]|uniref:NHL repeat-containing protein n=1 Tax=Chitinophaga filiformis TaxID=104663 RepID=A0A1G7Y314_CHIFI|nr:hypothetical protein [Chitinophaga filiformis]SDG90390.1 hypothetical protein SAMN04488121_107170 [Chitinophaga filiformis]